MTDRFQHVGFPKEIPNIRADTTPEGRFYKTPEGNVYPSVTTVLGDYNKEGIQRWIERVGVEEAERIRNTSASRGDAVHKIIEAYLLNQEAPSNAMPINMHMFSTMRPIYDKYISKIYGVEVPLYSDYLKVAGRADFVAEFNGVCSIIDNKTSLRLKKKEWIAGYFMQMSAYAVMVEELTGMAVPQIVVIIGVDGEREPQVFVEKRDNYISEFIKTRIKYNQDHGV